MKGAGRMNASVVFQSPTTAADSYLGKSTTWTAVVTASAAIESALSAESIASLQTTAVVPQTVTVWYSAALAAAGPTWRILWGTRVLEVQSVEDRQQRHRELTFLCREVQT